MATLTHSPLDRFERPVTACLYEQVMGPSFHRLHPAIRNFHRAQGSRRFEGAVTCDAPSSRLGQLLARMLGAPLHACAGTLVMYIVADASKETWKRRFADQHVMRSTMHVSRGRLVERLGEARLVFELVECDGRLQMHLARLRFFGIPCPSWLMPKIHAEERGQGMELHFDVSASLPFVGTVASYRGWLVVLHR
jgi:hypothetical protein